VLFLGLSALFLLAGLPPAHAAEQPNVIVLGIDGMDPKLLEKFVAQGKMPNFERLMREGSYSPLGTSIPPQSPVAWSNFITGLDSGGHGIFDFIHQDRTNYMPTFSAALVEAPARTFRLGKYVIPLSRGKVELLRQGTAFWQLLDTGDVPYLVFRVPANFPPTESNSVSVAGMGTPDLLGTYGMFSFYTDDPTLASLDVSGGRVYPVEIHASRVEAEFHGPENSMLVDHPELTTPFVVHIDKLNRSALIDIGHDRVLLEEGEWSEWFEIRFKVMGPFKTVSGITRFYLKSIEPYFQLYATPININPQSPALPLSSEPAFYKQLSERIGYFYTQGMPEDTKALEWGMFTDAEFVEQTEFVFQERLKMLDAILNDYQGGFLFFYFSSIDQCCHMLWRNMDPAHPGHNPETARYGDHIESLYVRMDSVLAEVQSRIPEGSTIIAMSDHGFAPFYKKVNLNTWLYENNYMSLKRPDDIGMYPLYNNVFWRRTRAFALGINGLYVNVRGREAQGVVQPGEDYDELLDEISARLLEYRDPETGEQVVKEVYRGSEIYHGDLAKDGPDLVIGYAGGYRASDRTAIGQLSKAIITPNMDKWSGDHCMALDVVPGILVTNLPVTLDDPTLLDLSATILALYGIAPAPNMRGRVLFGKGKTGSP
jgi:predicted AlkP superfamily phosphohydrolase/phosphomutase